MAADILADEPIAALERNRGRQVMELLRKIAHSRGSAIVVTHDHRALVISDTIYELEDGLIGTAMHPVAKPGAPHAGTNSC